MFNGITLLSSFIINSQILCLKKLTELSYLTEQVTAFITSWNTMPIYCHDAKCSKLCFGNNTVIKEVMSNCDHYRFLRSCMQERRAAETIVSLS